MIYVIPVVGVLLCGSKNGFNVIPWLDRITVESEKVIIKLLQFFTTRERNTNNITTLLVVIFTSYKEYFMMLFLTFNSYGLDRRCCIDRIFDVIPAKAGIQRIFKRII